MTGPRRVPQLHENDVQLRPWRGDDRDLDAILLASRDEEIQRYSSVGLVRTRGDAEHWLKTRRAAGRMDWVVERAGEIVGRVGLHKIDESDLTAEIGYWLLPDARGTGLASRAVRELTRYSFAELGLERLEIEHASQNAASCLVAQRCGFAAEGLRRSAFSHAGVRYDAHLHARLRTD